MNQTAEVIHLSDELEKRLDHTNPQGLPTGGGGGTYDGMEARVAKLESDVEYIKRDVSDLRQDVRELRNALDSKFVLTWAGLIGGVLLTWAGLIAGFLWIADRLP